MADDVEPVVAEQVSNVHVLQSLNSIPPVFERNIPAGHTVYPADPVTVLYFPGEIQVELAIDCKLNLQSCTAA